MLYICLYVEFGENGGLWGELADQRPTGYSGLSGRWVKEHVPPLILRMAFTFEFKENGGLEANRPYRYLLAILA